MGSIPIRGVTLQGEGVCLFSPRVYLKSKNIHLSPWYNGITTGSNPVNRRSIRRGFVAGFKIPRKLQRHRTMRGSRCKINLQHTWVGQMVGSETVNLSMLVRIQPYVSCVKLNVERSAVNGKEAG